MVRWLRIVGRLAQVRVHTRMLQFEAALQARITQLLACANVDDAAYVLYADATMLPVTHGWFKDRRDWSKQVMTNMLY